LLDTPAEVALTADPTQYSIVRFASPPSLEVAMCARLTLSHERSCTVDGVSRFVGEWSSLA
jgi:hypothetical protein